MQNSNYNHLNIEKITHICCGYPDRLDAINYPKAPLDSYEKISKMLSTDHNGYSQIQRKPKNEYISFKSKMIIFIKKIQLI